MGNIPRENTKLVIESSSIWKAPFFQIRDELGVDVVPSHPYATKLIAQSKKKTDKVDARILADMLRGGYIVVPRAQQKGHGAPGSGGIATSWSGSGRLSKTRYTGSRCRRASASRKKPWGLERNVL